jgi:hypothetical protein
MEDEGPLVDHRGVANALALCGCSVEQKNALIGEGFNNMTDFLVIQAKDVVGMCADLARMPVNRGGIKIGIVTMKKVEALVMWCHDRKRKGLKLDANAFDLDTLTEYVKKGQLDDAGSQPSPVLAVHKRSTTANKMLLSTNDGKFLYYQNRK